MQELARDEYSYKVERDHLDDAALCKCGSCGALARYDQLRPIGDCSLTPGDPSPAGRCPDPSCDSLAYPERPEEPAGLMAAVRALYEACGEEGSDEEAAIADLPSALNEALAEVIRFGSPHYVAAPPLTSTPAQVKAPKGGPKRKPKPRAPRI